MTTPIRLNQIFYGPPGTGKTYSTIDEAIRIIDGVYPKNGERNNRFQALQKAGQIELITFHQNYAYEDFMEGIKPKMKEENILYEIKDGVFKRIANRANEDSKKTHNATNVRKLIEKYVNHIKEKLNNNEIIYLKGKGQSTIKQIRYDKEGNFQSFVLGGSVTSPQSLSFNIIMRDYERFNNGEIAAVRDIMPKGQAEREHLSTAIYYFSLYKRIQEFSQQSNLTLNEQEIKRKHYVLIIDEINRGNISKIFGELITLVEKSKRLGQKDELSLTLPYSNEPFGVPDNLYIIGTMNTADRSIALLDTALRRRFSFIEMMPDENKLKEVEKNKGIKGILLSKLLAAINENITALYDREHQIGHTYFMDINTIEDLKDAFQQKIIPLLQEYFFDDREKIDQILNKNGFIIPKPYSKDSSKKIFDILPKSKNPKKDKWKDPALYKKIYGGNNEPDQS